jgi:hypothetical protein
LWNSRIGNIGNNTVRWDKPDPTIMGVMVFGSWMDKHEVKTERGDRAYIGFLITPADFGKVKQIKGA